MKDGFDIKNLALLTSNIFQSFQGEPIKSIVDS